MPEVRVEVDRAICIGAENCVRIASGAFAIDDEGLATVTDPSTATADQLAQAERDCPSGAIRVSDA